MRPVGAADLGDHGIVVDADVTSLLDAAVHADLPGKSFYSAFSLSEYSKRVFAQQMDSHMVTLAPPVHV